MYTAAASFQQADTTISWRDRSTRERTLGTISASVSQWLGRQRLVTDERSVPPATLTDNGFVAEVPCVPASKGGILRQGTGNREQETGSRE
jgi:hypothetical protein